MKRRSFILTGITSGLSFSSIKTALSSNQIHTEKTSNLVAVMGGTPQDLLITAINNLGGIKNFVKPGQNIVIKPNIGWDRKPEMAANTNPDLISSLVKLCIEAGAKSVSVFDHTCDNWQRCYQSSGIEAAVKASGGTIIPGNDEVYYKEVDIPHGINLKKAKIHKILLEADAWINVPILKNHGGAKMTIAMKNYMGIVWDRGYFHQNDLQQCIADICTWDKKPVLNIVDAYRVMRQNGPQGKSEADTALLKTLIASTDIVAVDTAAVKFFNQIEEMKLEAVSHLTKGEQHKLGTTNLDKINIKRIKLQ